MQLEGGVAARLAGQREAGVRLGCVQSTFQLVAHHGAGVGRHPIAGSAQETVDRLAERVADQIPEGQVDRG